MNTGFNDYLATFYTHTAAVVSSRQLKNAGIQNRMMPVPRSLSSSCGVCIRYQAENEKRELMDEELEAVYRVTENGDYTKL